MPARSKPRASREDGPNLPHLGVYLRVSSDEQARTGYSLEFQETRCLEWADFRYGKGDYSHQVYRDEGRKGTLGFRSPGVRGGNYREGLTALVRDIEAGHIDHVVIYRLDRLSRSPKLTHTFLENVLLKHNVGLTSITEGFDASTKEGRMLVGMLASVAAYYLDCLAENVRDGLRTRALKGKYSSKPPFGWRWREASGPDGEVRRGEVLEVVPEEARWVKQAAEWLLAGWGTAKIARELNRLGVRTSTGNQWEGKAVNDLLRSPVHCGMMYAGEALVEGEHGPMRIYPPETREAIVGTLEARRQMPSRTKGAVHVLLGGIARCGNCGRGLRVHFGERRGPEGRRHLSYRCAGNDRLGEGECGGVGIAMRKLDTWVIQQVLGFAASGDMARLTTEAAKRDAVADRDRLERDVAQLRERLGEMETRFDRWAEALEAGAMTVQQFRARNEKMLASKAERERALEEAGSKLTAQGEQDRLLVEVQSALRDLPGVWEKLEPEERKEVLRLVVEELTVARSEDGSRAARIRLRYGPVREEPV
jgi:site-specific DNA recombinase